ncbi:cobyrinate a,c-diamide synthase [Ihubacter sp. mB4P-1]|uniref:cobyrinate a,c-diamide synthase n=1 Tax=Ihubacter sp. mB4P-1 TaxID=3242370 RepID=UPI001379F8B1
MNTKVSRIMLAGTGSGCGKTTVTCALLKALSMRGVKAASFKCGPDYIDPMFHSEIIGTKSRNLDLFLCGENTVKYLLSENGKDADVAVIEGVMGMYDGLGFADDTCSANHISRVTETPELLIAGVRGKSLSLLAELSGYLHFAENQVAGVILNHCSKAMYPVYKEMIEERLSIKVYGFLPPVAEAQLSSRHLGLVTAAEIDDLKEKMEALGRAAEASLDIDGILQLASSAPALSCEEIRVQQITEKPVSIAVAKDKAFCFYYEDNFTLLKRLGAELVPFSPLTDKEIPAGVCGLVLGGGYPEEYLQQLSRNTSMLVSVREAAAKGMPVYAECGGFMYLGKSIEKDGSVYTMAGVLEGRSHMTEKLVRFGYKSLTANRDNLMCRQGEAIRCHEFHYSDSDFSGDGFTASKGSRSWQAVCAGDTVFAGYPHLHLWSNLHFAENFVKKCEAFAWKSSSL